MKRFFGAILSVMLVFAVAGTAAASMVMGDLVMAVYNKTTTKEVMFDLGTTTGIAAGTGAAYTGLFDLAALGGVVNVGAYGYKAGGGLGEAWFVTTSASAPGINASSLGAFFGGGGPPMTYHNNLGGAIGNTEDPGSYTYKMNSKGVTPGQYAGYNANWVDGEAVLDSIDDVATLYLYGYNLSLPIDGPGYEAILTVHGNGNVEVSAVPVPGALLLMGSGLLGLLGIRRKKA